ncbi:hypothetical protein J6590_083713 [Homalodisca vitripennis]|nr:hypothetical protein J6590_083713 [Homalodisca vitripennis]
MGLLEVLDVQRRHHGTYNEAAESRRQTTVTDFLMAPGNSKGDVSHYTRNKSEREYLSQDLNMNRIFSAFKEKYPDIQTHDAVESNKAKQQLELHHRKAERCINRAEKLLNLQYSTWQPKLYGTRMQVMEDLQKVIEEARPSKPFKVLKMADHFFDFDKAASSCIDTKKKLGISQISVIKVDQIEPGFVSYKKYFNDLCPWEKLYVVKKGKTITDIENVEFEQLPANVQLPENKKKDLRTMIPYLDENNRNFYRVYGLGSSRLQSQLQVDRLARRIPVPPENQTIGHLLRPEIRPGAYRAGSSGVSAPYYGSTPHYLELC